MAYDIYGDILRRGHCEVHPWVHEDYPCSLCYSESRKPKVKDPQELFQEQAEAEYHDQQERAYYEGLAKERSRMYRIVDALASLVGNINERILKYRERLLREAVQQ